MSHELIESCEMIGLIGFIIIIFGAVWTGIGFVIFAIILHFMTHAGHGGHGEHNEAHH